MQKPIRILLQTTIPETADDWHIGRFALLRDHLASLTDERGKPLVEVTARNRRDMESDDSVLSTLDGSTIDELWLLAVDMGNGLTSDDCRGITRFHERGGGLLVMRDHQDWGRRYARSAASAAPTISIARARNPTPRAMLPTIPAHPRFPGPTTTRVEMVITRRSRR